MPARRTGAAGRAAGTRIALLSDIHGNAVALEAVVKALKKEKPDHVIVAGDIVMNGPAPAEALDGVRALEAAGALVVQGNTDIAVADGDYAAAFPWLTEGVPDPYRWAAEWAHDQLGDERLDWLRRLPAERRLLVETGGAGAADAGAADADAADAGVTDAGAAERASDGGADGSAADDDPEGETVSAAIPSASRSSDRFLVLGCHASPGSQTAGLDANLDPSVTLERLIRTDARLICVGHTHVPAVHDFGWKIVVNGGSAGWVFDGDPTASWAMVTIAADGTIEAEIRRTEFDTLAVSNALSARGLPGDVYRAATVRTGKLVR